MGGGVVFQLGGASFLKGVRHGASILMEGRGRGAAGFGEKGGGQGASFLRGGRGGQKKS